MRDRAMNLVSLEGVERRDECASESRGLTDSWRQHNPVRSRKVTCVQQSFVEKRDSGIFTINEPSVAWVAGTKPSARGHRKR